MPRILIRELIKQGNEFLNAFGSKDILGDGLTPRNIIDNLPHIDYNDLKYEFGQYVQLHVTEKVTNTMKSRTIGAIVMGPRKIQGRYNFMSLETGAEINGRVVAEIPLTVEVIERVESLGKAQNQPFRASKILKYEWRPGITVAEDDAYLTLEDASNGDSDIIPNPIWQEHPAIGPNPFVIDPLQGDDDGAALQGAQENNGEGLQPNHQNDDQNDDNDEEGAPHGENQGAQHQGEEGMPLGENQGAQHQGAPLVENQDENQGASEDIPNIKEEQDDIHVEDVEEDEDTDDEEEPVGRRAEKER